MTTTGSVTLFPAPSFGTGKQGIVMSVAAGPDGNLWFTEELGKHLVLGRMSPSGTAPTPITVANLQWGLVADGHAGTLVVSGQTTSLRSEAFQVSTAGAVTRYKISAANTSAFFDYLGPASGSLWFTSEFAAINGPLKIGRITQAGSVRSYDVSKFFRGHARAVGSMALGSDGDMYVLDTLRPTPRAGTTRPSIAFRRPVSRSALSKRISWSARRHCLLRVRPIRLRLTAPPNAQRPLLSRRPLGFLLGRIPDDQRVNHRKTKSVAGSPASSPPRIARASGAFASLPCSMASARGIKAKNAASAVIVMGRTAAQRPYEWPRAASGPRHAQLLSIVRSSTPSWPPDPNDER